MEKEKNERISSISSKTLHLVIAKELIERALDDLDQADKDGGIEWLNKYDFNKSLKSAMKLILDSYVD